MLVRRNPIGFLTKITSLSIVVMLMVTACSDKYNLSAKQKAFLISTIDSMYVKDQSPRLLLGKTDSVFGLGAHASGLGLAEKKALLGDRYAAYQHKTDSLWAVIKHNDTLNTRQLIAITETYGFPDNMRLGVYKSKAYWIFVHSPSVYFDRIKRLVEREFKAGRMSEYKKEYIFWHINGRKGMPPRSGANGEAIWIN